MSCSERGGADCNSCPPFVFVGPSLPVSVTLMTIMSSADSEVESVLSWQGSPTTVEDVSSWTRIRAAPLHLTDEGPLAFSWRASALLHFWTVERARHISAVHMARPIGNGALTEPMMQSASHQCPLFPTLFKVSS
jgi:hypothetical protein